MQKAYANICLAPFTRHPTPGYLPCRPWHTGC